MSSAVMELDTYLQSMLNLKPPGVSGSKISSITSLCTANVQVSHPIGNTQFVLIRIGSTVRIRPHSKDLHTLQEST